MLYIPSIQELLNGVEPRSTGYQDGNRYWNLDLEFDRDYDQEFIGRVVEDGDRYVFLAGTAEADDHIAYSSLKPGQDNMVEETLAIEMRGDRSTEELYREVCRALEPDSYSMSGTASKAQAALD